jgi:hypothetical protein
VNPYLMSERAVRAAVRAADLRSRLLFRVLEAVMVLPRRVNGYRLGQTVAAGGR